MISSNRIRINVIRSPLNGPLSGVVRVLPEAEMALRKLSRATGLPMRDLASAIITQSVSLGLIDIVNSEEEVSES